MKIGDLIKLSSTYSDQSWVGILLGESPGYNLVKIYVEGKILECSRIALEVVNESR